MQGLKFTTECRDGGEEAPQDLSVFQEFWFEVNRVRIHCLKAGRRGRPVLLLHGGGFDAAGLSLRKAIPAFAEQHRVFAPDWPGFGQSDPMPSRWRVEECIDFVGRLLDALGLRRASLVGLSMGGAFAIGFALRVPERVERLVLVDSAGLGDEIPGGFLSYFRVQLPLVDELSWALLAGSRTLARRNVCAALVNRKQVVSEELLDEIILLARRAGAGAAFRQLQRSEYQWRGMRTTFLHRLSEIQAPTLLVHGVEDRVVPVTWAMRAHSLIKNSKIEIFPECGHLPPIEQPDLFNRVVRGFLGVRRPPAQKGTYPNDAPDLRVSTLRSPEMPEM